jgi:hypothetical protein
MMLHVMRPTSSNALHACGRRMNIVILACILLHQRPLLTSSKAFASSKALVKNFYRPFDEC